MYRRASLVIAPSSNDGVRSTFHNPSCGVIYPLAAEAQERVCNRFVRPMVARCPSTSYIVHRESYVSFDGLALQIRDVCSLVHSVVHLINGFELS